MTGTSGREGSSRMRVWWVSPLESPWETKLPKVLWRSFYVRLGKCAMLGSAQLWNLFGSCLAGLSEIPTSRKVREKWGTQVLARADCGTWEQSKHCSDFWSLSPALMRGFRSFHRN